MNLDKSKIFLVFALSFIGGVVGRSFWNFGLLEFYEILIVAIIVFAIGYKKRTAMVVVGMISFFVLGVWRTNLSLAKVNNLRLNNQEFAGLVKVAREPIKKDKYLQIITKLPGGERVLIKSYSPERFEYGDEIELKCKLKTPKNFSDFDYRMFLAKDKIYYICQKTKIKKTDNNKGNKIYTNILRLKNAMERNIERSIPQPEAGLASGLLFGGSDYLPEKIKNDFSRTGMTHIVAVSGYNVTIIAEYLIYFGIFVGLWRNQAFWLALFGVFIFVAMIGFPGSAVRAGVMASLLLWAMKNGRLTNADNAIIFSAGIMLLINPLSLRWDIGFQLSFLATLGIIKLSPIWEKYFSNRFRSLGITEIILMTVSAQLFVLPIITLNFQTVSLISLLANLLILPIIPLTMSFVFLTAIWGFVLPLSVSVFSWLSYFFLRYEIGVVDLLARFSWASVKVNNFSHFWFFAYYVIVILTVHILNKIRKKKMVF